VKIVGEVLVPLSLGEGDSALEVTYKFLVHEGGPQDILAMDFLTDFQSVIDLGAEETITINRRPREPQESYAKLYLDLTLRAADGKASCGRFLVDTGGLPRINRRMTKELGLQ